MWFVWDGRTRLGPQSEDEICRRVLQGEWPLSIYVRPENSSIYRPLIWMLPEWTSPRHGPELERTIVRGSTPMHEATQIASRSLFSKIVQTEPQGQSPREVANPIPDLGFFEPPVGGQPPAAAVSEANLGRAQGQGSVSGSGRGLANGDFDFLTTELAGPRERRQEIRFEQLSESEVASGELVSVAPFSLTPAGGSSFTPPSSSANQKSQHSGSLSNGRSENSVVRAAQAAIAEGERLSREFENRGQKPNVNEAQDEQRIVVDKPRNGSFGRSAVQSPARASEGSVNLVDQESATQIKFRRVNPTAPRRRSRSAPRSFVQRLGLASLSRGFARRAGRSGSNSQTIVYVVAGFLTAALLGGVIYLLTMRKAKVNLAPEEQVIFDHSKKRAASSSGQLQSNELNKSDKVQGKKKKAMSARDPADATPKGKFLSNAGELQAYLKQTTDRGFIVIGPMTIKERPRKGCEPCLGSGQLPDGTIINLSSVMHQPWKAVSKSNVIYARGMLFGSGRMTLTVNALSGTPF